MEHTSYLIRENQHECYVHIDIYSSGNFWFIKRFSLIVILSLGTSGHKAKHNLLSIFFSRGESEAQEGGPTVKVESRVERRSPDYRAPALCLPPNSRSWRHILKAPGGRALPEFISFELLLPHFQER